MLNPFINQNTITHIGLPQNGCHVSFGEGTEAFPSEQKVGTGRQNSSKAGFTKVVYWVRICSRSLPRLTSRRTAVGQDQGGDRRTPGLRTSCGQGRRPHPPYLFSTA